MAMLSLVTIIFPKIEWWNTIDRYDKTWNNNTWDAIKNVLEGPQAVWLIGVGEQTVSQFVLEMVVLLEHQKNMLNY
jgi:hypothetical protein